MYRVYGKRPLLCGRRVVSWSDKYKIWRWYDYSISRLIETSVARNPCLHIKKLRNGLLDPQFANIYSNFFYLINYRRNQPLWYMTKEAYERKLFGLEIRI